MSGSSRSSGNGGDRKNSIGSNLLHLSVIAAASSVVFLLRHKQQHQRRCLSTPSSPVHVAKEAKTEEKDKLPEAPEHAAGTLSPTPHPAQPSTPLQDTSPTTNIPQSSRSSPQASSTPIAQTPPTPFIPRAATLRKSSITRGGGLLSSSALRLSERPQAEVQERVSHALGMCPGMEEIGKRRIELMVHNVSHKDMVLSLARHPPSSSSCSVVGEQQRHHRRTSSSNSSSNNTTEDLVLCRPKFSLFQPVSQRILQAIRSLPPSLPCPPATFPVYVRELHSSRDPAAEAPSPSFPPSSSPSSDNSTNKHGGREGKREQQRSFTLRRQRPGSASAHPDLPVGFDLSRSSYARHLAVEDLASFRVRRDDAQKLEFDPQEQQELGQQQQQKREVNGLHSSSSLQRLVQIDGVYFPLLASILPKWRSSLHITAGAGMTKAEDEDVFKIIFLVSGVGMPRDQTSSTEGNSTEGTAELLEEWIRWHYRDVRVVRVHSKTNIFRYDENIAFVKNELLPLVEHYRDRSAERWGTDWRYKYHLTISFADGSPARISAINAALRPYRPSFVHMWELKTFWHHAKMCLEDVEVLAFEDIDTAPPVPLSHADARAQLVAAEMLRYKEEVLHHYHQGLCSDLSTFWLRKTQKPVLAVLLIQKEGGAAPILYRGCNMEVSMPTGSLCAERNAIGSALAADLTLKRRELKIVAVLSLSFTEGGGREDGKQREGGRIRREGVGPKRLDMAFASVEKKPGKKGSGGSSSSSDGRVLTGSPHKKQEDRWNGTLHGGVNEQEGAAAVAVAAAATNEEGPSTPRGEKVGRKTVFEGASPPRVTVIRSYSLKDLTLDGAGGGGGGGGSGGVGGVGGVGGPTMAERQRRPHSGSLDALDPVSSPYKEGKGMGERALGREGKEVVQSETKGGAARLSSEAMTITVDSEDLNPLRPCGACMEWLKKISEQNPEFRVATFTDEKCRGIYTEFVSTTST
ncbi:hypothetical protein VYU27_003623 [Nannochloropsis oceanica]